MLVEYFRARSRRCAAIAVAAQDHLTPPAVVQLLPCRRPISARHFCIAPAPPLSSSSEAQHRHCSPAIRAAAPLQDFAFLAARRRASPPRSDVEYHRHHESTVEMPTSPLTRGQSPTLKYLAKAASAVGPRIGPRWAIGLSIWAETVLFVEAEAAGWASLSYPLSSRPGRGLGLVAGRARGLEEWSDPP
ncbi:hypothetical protein AAHA92_17477 [Salvia divinorum]|uniref:Uncharacterized protein n=1 Tax=Salvia divinorum TaxID=28513 RepID=A0ABD1H1S2_SALDI